MLSDFKHELIHRLPPEFKRLLAIPYDFYQTQSADRSFRRKSLPTETRSPDSPDHIVIVVVDALRADHVTDTITPFLTSMNTGTAVTPGSWTFPTVSSLLTGLYPHEHGAIKQSDETYETNGLKLPPRMEEDRDTITEYLAGAGYDTYGGFGHDTPFVALSGRFRHHDLFHTISADADDVLGAYLDWVGGREQTFAFIHLADPHTPLTPPAEYRRKHEVDETIENLENWDYQSVKDCEEPCQKYRDHHRRLYRAAVDYVDDAIERFTDSLQENLDDPLLVVTSDHGEAMWEHESLDQEYFGGTGIVGHGGTPYEELARVPIATNAEWVLDGPISLIDLPSTIMDMAGIQIQDMSGYSLVDGIHSDRMPICESSLYGYEKKAIYYDENKLIVSNGDGVELQFQLPGEKRIEIPEDVREKMHDRLPAWPDGSTAKTDVSGVVENRLKKLGYR